ncbi:MAG: histidinol-phosphatase [Oscillospiraceae bacterium]|nr:histidinol-phosphatase [Oscillospiraceae bacterium]
MKANYHTHTLRCRHAQGTERDYVEAAVKAGLGILGFSDHAPFPDFDFGLRMPYDELHPYLDAIDRLTGEFISDIILYKSLEIEYIPQYQSYYEGLLAQEGLDYLLMGEHFYPDRSGIIRNIYHARSTADAVDYAKAVVRGMETGLFRMVAHPDLFTLGQFAWDGNWEEASERIVEAAARTGVILELNANGLRRGIHDYPDGPRLMYPHRRFWEKAAEAGVPVIIGSDCHEPAQVWDGCMSAAREMLQTWGITPLEMIEGLGSNKS